MILSQAHIYLFFTPMLTLLTIVKNVVKLNMVRLDGMLHRERAKFAHSSFYISSVDFCFALNMLIAQLFWVRYSPNPWDHHFLLVYISISQLDCDLTLNPRYN